MKDQYTYPALEKVGPGILGGGVWATLKVGFTSHLIINHSDGGRGGGRGGRGGRDDGREGPDDGRGGCGACGGMAGEAKVIIEFIVTKASLSLLVRMIPLSPSAAVLGGVSDIWIKPDFKILYIGAAAGTSVSHVSDIVGPS
jgi:rRNA 2'-O-methyltransferase fibrillarin